MTEYNDHCDPLAETVKATPMHTGGMDPHTATSVLLLFMTSPTCHPSRRVGLFASFALKSQ